MTTNREVVPWISHLGGNAFGDAPRKTLHHRPQNHQPIGRAQRAFNGPLGVRHQARHVAFAIRDAGNCGERTIRIRLEIVRTSVAAVRVA